MKTPMSPISEQNWNFYFTWYFFWLVINSAAILPVFDFHPISSTLPHPTLPHISLFLFRPLQSWNVLIPLHSQPGRGGEGRGAAGLEGRGRSSVYWDCVPSMYECPFVSRQSSGYGSLIAPLHPLPLAPLPQLWLNGALCLTKVSHSRLNGGN